MKFLLCASASTGHGLRLFHPCDKVVEIYGQPSSRRPSTKDGRELELLYQFDWAGPDVPQVMEVLCTSGEREGSRTVVEIMLAAGSL